MNSRFIPSIGIFTVLGIHSISCLLFSVIESDSSLLIDGLYAKDVGNVFPNEKQEIAFFVPGRLYKAQSIEDSVMAFNNCLLMVSLIVDISS